MYSAKNISAAIYFVIIFTSVLCLAKPVYIPVSTVSGGEDHTLILANDKTVWGCGRNSDTSYYVLGDGTNIERNIPVQVHGVNNVNYLQNIIAIAGGWTHSLALDANNHVWAWGDSSYGQLGNGSTDGSAVPVKVLGGDQGTPFLKYIASISAGRSGEHSLAVDANHFCYAWGRNYEGQLGDYSNTNRYTPVKVHGINNNGYFTNIIAVSGGANHSMVLDANGFVYTFGSNTYRAAGEKGKLGTNSTVDYNKTPVKVLAGEQNPNYPTTAFLQNIKAISAGWDHSMALEKIDHNDSNCQGRVYTWGYNSSTVYTYGGRLGNGQTTDSNSSPVIVHAGEQDSNHPNTYLKNIIAISAGEGHCIALEKFNANDPNCKGRVYTWGDNTYGQLGNGTSYPYLSLTPVKVVGPDGTGYLKDIVYISAGYWHNLAVDKQGTVWVWGNGANGRLGIGSDADANRPTPLHIYDLNVHNKTQNKWYKRIQPAVTDANNNDVIEVNEGYFCENINLSGKPLTLKSRDPNNWSIVDNTRIYGSSWLNYNEEVGNPPIHMSGNNGSVITGLTLIAGGNGIECFSSSNPVISHCNIRDNVYNGISVSGDNRAPTIINNIIHHNHSDGGIFLNGGSSTQIRNNTIVGNYCYGIYSAVDPCIYNNIVWGNNAGSLVGPLTKVHFNCIENYTGSCSYNITSDPCFRDAGANNFHLKYNSPCIDKGDSNNIPLTEIDIDGEARVNVDSNRVDIGADEFYPCTDKDVFPLPPDGPDGIVNFMDFVVLADAWMTSSGSNNYNDAVDFIDDGGINKKDLKEFCDCWLYRTADFDSRIKMQMMMLGDSISQSPSESAGSLAVADTATELTAESQEEQQPSEEQSFMPDYNLPAIYLTCDVNTPEPNDEVTIWVHSDTPLLAMGIGIYIIGDMNITSAMNEADCNSFGWDNGWNSDPYIDPNGWVYLSGVKWVADANGTVGYVKFRYHSGQVSVYIDQEYSEAFAFDWDSQYSSYVSFSQETLYIRDPNDP